MQKPNWFHPQASPFVSLICLRRLKDEIWKESKQTGDIGISWYKAASHPFIKVVGPVVGLCNRTICDMTVHYCLALDGYRAWVEYADGTDENVSLFRTKMDKNVAGFIAYFQKKV